MAAPDDLDIVPLTDARWDDFAALLGPKGAYGGCWCMYWRRLRRDFEAGAGERNREAMRTLAQETPAPGLLAYRDGRPVGWIAVAPRRAYPRLERSRVLHPVDGQEVWSVSCFFIARSARRCGVGLALLEAACDFVRDAGGHVLEGYPIAPSKSAYPAAYAWTGFEAVFRRAGFREVARRSATRPIMRRLLDP